jgi:hypothetical protein
MEKGASRTSAAEAEWQDAHHNSDRRRHSRPLPERGGRVRKKNRLSNLNQRSSASTRGRKGGQARRHSAPHSPRRDSGRELNTDRFANKVHGAREGPIWAAQTPHSRPQPKANPDSTPPPTQTPPDRRNSPSNLPSSPLEPASESFLQRPLRAR